MRKPVLDRDQHQYKHEKHPDTAGDQLGDDQGEDHADKTSSHILQGCGYPL